MGVAGVLGWVGSGVGLVLIVLVAPCDLAFMCRFGIGISWLICEGLWC